MRTCDQCNTPIGHKPAKARFCGTGCRNAFHAEKRRGQIAATVNGTLTGESRAWALCVLRESRAQAKILIKTTLNVSEGVVDGLEKLSWEG